MRVEMNSGATSQQCSGLVHCHTTTKRPVFTNRIKAINNRDDSCRYWDLFTLKAIRISATVPAFVMMTDDRHDGIRKVHATQYLRTHNGVNLHLLKLCGCQSPGLIQDMWRHGEFADIVQ